MRLPPLALVCAATAAAAAPPTPASAQGQWPPRRLENVKVLPDTTPVRQVVDLMRGITRALGVRCTYCHVGEERQPLSDYDFPSDEKPTKRKARDMLRMVQAINGQYLGALEERQNPPVTVECITCHRGVTTPRTLQTVLLLAYDAGGLDSTLAAYTTLRQRYFGRAAYDFGEVPLADVAAELVGRDRLGDAERLYALNVEQNPESRFARTQHARLAVELAFATAGPDSGAARYHALHATYGPAAFPEPVLNEVGRALLRRGKPAAAVAAFSLNAESFPRSADPQAGLGEAYAALGDTARAIASFERAVELDPANRNAARRLDTLRGGRL